MVNRLWKRFFPSHEGGFTWWSQSMWTGFVALLHFDKLRQRRWKPVKFSLVLCKSPTWSTLQTQIFWPKLVVNIQLINSILHFVVALIKFCGIFRESKCFFLLRPTYAYEEGETTSTISEEDEQKRMQLMEEKVELILQKHEVELELE